MTEDSHNLDFRIKLRALVKEYFLDNMGHEIKINLPHDSSYQYYTGFEPK